MADQILRAGPWGRLTSTHEDVPADTSTYTGVYPVNCAKGDWPNQSWLAQYQQYLGPTDIDGNPVDHVYGVASLGQDVVVTSNFWGTCDTDFRFCYQATQEFDVYLTWAFTGETVGNYPSLGWLIRPIGEPSVSYFNTPVDSGVETITLPASTFCQVSIFVGGYGPGEGLVLTASLS